MNSSSAGPERVWQSRLENQQLTFDPGQKPVIEALQKLYLQLQERSKQKNSFLGRLFKRTETPENLRGLYIWGDVGRGKTMLMDLFYDSLPADSTTRLHFHRFMQRIHQALRELDGQQNPLQTVAQQWADKSVICFDEFYVSDIADAMLLGELMQALFAQGVVLVATSNTAPENLYLGGLQRARFLPAIEAINNHCQTLHLDSAIDYRLRILEKSPVYHSPLSSGADNALEKIYAEINPGSERGHTDLLINSRLFQARHRGDGIIWFDFDELCEKPRGTVDYIEIARAFNTVLISNVPHLNDDKADSLRRFINLVDEFYDRGVNLVISAATDIDSLYQGERLAFEFRRTYSRLNEMQTHAYLAQAHQP